VAGGPNAGAQGARDSRRQPRGRRGRPGAPIGPNDMRSAENARNGRPDMRGPDPRAGSPNRQGYGGTGNGYRRDGAGGERSGERSRYYGDAPGHRAGYDRPRRARERRDIPFTDLLKELQQQTSIDPTERLKLETTPDVVSMRALEMIAPIGKGQRCLITAPPKAGKTTLLQEIAVALSKNHPDIEVLVLLVDERPEEVTHFRRSVPCEVMAASSDQTASEHVEIAEKALTRVLVPVLEGKDVVVLLDSITRLARAYNTNFQGIGRTLSGGLDATTMQVPRQIFGAARNIENGGSLTILGTALVDTGSRMDEVIFQEFKGTGNMELVLSRALFEKRVFPCIDIKQSGTRKEEKLYGPEEMRALHALRRRLVDRDPETAMLELIELLRMYPTNELLLSKLM
jgi:transcription termination factor Rho